MWGRRAGEILQLWAAHRNIRGALLRCSLHKLTNPQLHFCTAHHLEIYNARQREDVRRDGSSFKEKSKCDSWERFYAFWQ